MPVAGHRAVRRRVGLAKGRMQRQIGGDPDVGLASRKDVKIVRIVGDDESAAEPNSGGHDECINRHLTAPAGPCQEVPGDPRDARPCNHHPCETATQDEIDGFVSGPSIELQQHHRRNSDGSALLSAERRAARTRSCRGRSCAGRAERCAPNR